MLGFEIVAGPDAGRLLPLPVGRHVIGRAAGCGLVIHDPSVEMHHALVTVSPDGTLWFTQLAGRRPALVNGLPAGAGTAVAPGSAIEVGDSLLVLRAGAEACQPDSIGAGGRVVIGVGSLLAGEMHHHRSVVVDLSRSHRGVIGLTSNAADPGSGAASEGVVAAIIDQLAVDPTTCRWRVVRATGGRPVGRADAACGRVIVVTDRSAPLGERGIVDEIADEGAAVTVLLLTDPSSPMLRHCSAVLHLGARWRARWVADASDPLTVVRLHVRGQRAVA